MRLAVYIREMTRRTDADRRGTTLTEVIVSMTLIMMLLTMFSTVLMVGMRCQQYLFISSEMQAAADVLLYQIIGEAEKVGMSAEQEDWIGMTVHEDYQVEEICLSQEFEEYPEIIRVDLTLVHRPTGAVHHAFGYARDHSETAWEENDVLINDLSE